jgi:hypothetical protein
MITELEIPGEISLFTGEFRSHWEKKENFQGSLIKHNWNSRHPLLQTTFSRASDKKLLGNPGGRRIYAVCPQQGVYG